jgi:hypothetical protein
MIFSKPLLTKANLIYLGIALFVGGIISFGIVGMTYHPVPLQVPEDQYLPIAPPTPAIPTLAPQFIPNSSADEGKDAVPDKFAPAKPPMIVTTQPLPSITPVGSSQTIAVSKCNPNAWNSTSYCVIEENISSAFALANLLGIALITSGVAVILFGALSIPSQRRR